MKREFVTTHSTVNKFGRLFCGGTLRGGVFLPAAARPLLALARHTIFLSRREKHDAETVHDALETSSSEMVPAPRRTVPKGKRCRQRP